MIRKKPGMLVRWMLTNCVLLILPLALAVILCAAFTSALTDELYRSNTNRLLQLRNALDEKFYTTQAVQREMSMQADVTALAARREPLLPRHLFMAQNLIYRMRAMELSNRQTGSLLLYFKYNDFIVTKNAKYTLRDYYDIFLSQASRTYAQWSADLKQTTSFEWAAFNVRLTDGTMNRYIELMWPVSNSGWNEVNALIIFLQSEEEWADLFSQHKTTPDTQIILTDQNGRVVMSTDPKLTKVWEKSNALNSAYTQRSRLRLGDIEYVQDMAETKLGNWTCLSLVPVSALLAKAHWILAIGVAAIGVLLLCGLAAAYWFAKRQYNPIGAILQVLRKRGGAMQPEKKMDDLTEIQHWITKAIDREQQSKSNMMQRNRLLQQSLLQALLRGDVRDEGEWVEQAEQCNLVFRSDLFVVVHAFVERDMEEEGQLPDDALMTHFVPGNMLTEQLAQNRTVYLIEQPEDLTFLVSIAPEETETYRTCLRADLEYINALLIQHYSLFITAAVSSVQDSLWKVAQGEREVVTAMEVNRMMGGGQILFFEDMHGQNIDKHPLYGVEDESLLDRLIRQDSIGEALRLFHQLSQKMEQTRNIPAIRMALLSIANTIAQASSVLLDYSPEIMALSQAFTLDMIENKHTREMLEKIETYLIALAESQRDEGASHDDLICHVIEYIHNHYTEPNFSMAMIAEHFTRNTAYLARIFKERKHVSLPEYINEVRISKVKEMLLSTQLSLQEIALQVGYLHTNTLIRVFKKSVGITPGRFRENILDYHPNLG